MKTTTLILGCGDIGTALGRELLAAGHRVIGARRHPRALEGSGLEAVAVDLADPATLEGLPDADTLVYVVSADRFEEEAYRAAYPDGLKAMLQAFADRDRPRSGCSSSPRPASMPSATARWSTRRAPPNPPGSPAP